MASPLFRFKKFEICQEGAAHPLGTDAVLLGAWTQVENAGSVLDIGTGTGILAIMLAQRNPIAIMDAIDIHSSSVLCAQANAQRSPWADRIHVFKAPLQEFQGGPYDLIVSNPPYFSETTVSPHPHRRRARATVTLKPAELLTHTLRLLKPEGVLCVVLPVWEGRRFQELATLSGLYCNIEVDVRTQPDKAAERMLMQFSRDPVPFQRNEITIMDSSGRYSDNFVNLTREFYL